MASQEITVFILHTFSLHWPIWSVSCDTIPNDINKSYLSFKIHTHPIRLPHQNGQSQAPILTAQSARRVERLHKMIENEW